MDKLKTRIMVSLTFNELRKRLGIPEEMQIIEVIPDSENETLRLKVTSEQPEDFGNGMYTASVPEATRIPEIKLNDPAE